MNHEFVYWKATNAGEVPARMHHTDGEEEQRDASVVVRRRGIRPLLGAPTAL